MSKSLKRVLQDAERLGLGIEAIRLEDSTTTAQQAADGVGATVDQIVKSIVLRDGDTDQHVLFLTAGGNFVDLKKASDVSGFQLEKADAASIRAHTGFAIGGVSPLGHLNPIPTYFDPHILTFDTIWAAAGTPHHVFQIEPQKLLDVTKGQLADFTT